MPARAEARDRVDGLAVHAVPRCVRLSPIAGERASIYHHIYSPPKKKIHTHTPPNQTKHIPTTPKFPPSPTDDVCTDILHYEEQKLVPYHGNLSAFVARRPDAKHYYELSTETLK